MMTQETKKRIIGFCIAAVICSALFGCGIMDGDRFDGKITKDGEGHYYLMKYNIGDTYFIDELTEEEVKKVKTAKEKELKLIP